MRLKSEIWVKAYLRRCTVNGAMATVLRHGDDDAGTIFIKVVRADRTAAIFGPAPAGLDDADVGRRWAARLKGAFVADEEADRFFAKESSFDSDLWVIEVEDRDGRHFLGTDLVA
ncbi:MAG: DUF1491 family protein [Hyphomicrobium sp.]|mgnify:CR=1 FL=1|jgi:hypothetical protein|nr:DUF1491 family protein [Hyphomicrobium sp.]